MANNSIENTITQRAKEPFEYTPVLYNAADENDAKELQGLFDQHKIHRVCDDYEEQLNEYFQTTKPQLVYAPDFETKFQEYLAQQKQASPLVLQGRWAYFPWLATLVHILEEDAFFSVRTTRNQNLITTQEQKQYVIEQSLLALL